MPPSHPFSGRGRAPGQIPPRSSSARWPGDPHHRPTTEAEAVRKRAQWRSASRFVGVLLLSALVAFVWFPDRVLRPLHQVMEPPILHDLAWTLGFLLQRAYPFIQWGLIVVFAGLAVHLVIGLLLHHIQNRQRTRVTLTTLALDLCRVPDLDLGRGVDLFAAIGEFLSARGRLMGDEDRMVFALVNHTLDDRVRLCVRGPQIHAHQTAWMEALRHQVTGIAPGTTVHRAADDLQDALEQGRATGAYLGSCDLVLARPQPYPLKDLAMFLGSDPLGPLADSLRHGPGVTYSALELILRALPRTEDWRAPLRERIARIQGTLNPEDLSAYEALLRKVESAGFDLVIRLIVGADTPDHVRAQLQVMEHALQAYHRPVGDARQRLLRVGSRVPPQHGRWIAPLAPPRLRNMPRFLLQSILGVSCGGIAGVGLSTGLLQLRMARLLPPLLPAGIAQLAPPDLTMLLGGLGTLAGGLWMLSRHPALGAARDRQHLALLQSHAHRFVWPGSRWMPLPVPGTQRSIVGPYELAAFWHPPSLVLEPLFCWKSSKYLPPPTVAFLTPAEEAAARERTIMPEPTGPLDLAGRRLGLALADRADGTTGLIGPTVRDLRQGMDILGGTGSGKSSLIEVLVLELARNGGGFGVIDGKGDLCDRLLTLLPRAVHDRVVVIDAGAERVPSLNPFDRRMLAEGMPQHVLSGLMEQIFLRLDPETWPTSLGMQQFATFGIAALLEGEPTPTLYHLTRFYSSRTYHRQVLSHVRDPLVRDFWQVEVPHMDPKLKTSIDSFRRRLIKFVNTEIGQTMFCQPHPTLYLPDLLARRAIVIAKIVPENLSERNARFLSAAIFSAFVGAAFAQQRRERDPEQRWDWPLIVDEIQMFIDADNPTDAERMWTRTRSMGVGLIGAHQDLKQLGEALAGITLNVLGGLAILSAVRSNVMDFVNAYASQGLGIDDFSGIRAREELLVRFPVHGKDMGLMSARPRQRPPAVEADRAARRPALALLSPPAQPRDPTTAQAAAILTDLRREAEAVRAQGTPVDLVAITVADAWVTVFLDQAGAAYLQSHPSAPSAQAAAVARSRLQEMVTQIQAVIAAEAQAHLAALEADPTALPPAAYLTQRSELRYGTDPLSNALAIAAFARQYPAEALTPPKARQSAATPARRSHQPGHSPASQAGHSQQLPVGAAGDDDDDQTWLATPTQRPV